jgi:hypothetical protein
MKNIQILFVALCVVIPVQSFSSSLLDRKYQLGTVGILKPWSNIDGILDQPVQQSLKEYFSRQSRFVLNDLSASESLLQRSKLSYSQIIVDLEILGQLAQLSRTESLIRTRVVKPDRGGRYHFTLEWLHAPKMEELSRIEFDLIEPTLPGTALSNSTMGEVLHENLDRLMASVPFAGMVTGRDEDRVTINLGSTARLLPGDILKVFTLSSIKKHPITHGVVDWGLVATGKILIEQVDEGMAFCRVIEEEPNKRIERYQKINLSNPSLPTGHQGRYPAYAGAGGAGSSSAQLEKEGAYDPSQIPRLGRVAAGPGLGSYSWQYSSRVESISNSGGGFAFGGKADVDLWLTQEWFVSLGLGTSSFNFTQKANAGNTPSPVSRSGGVNGTLSTYVMSVGYNYFINPGPFGTKVWGKVGYKSSSYTLPFSSSEVTAPSTMGSVLLGAGGEMSVTDQFSAFGELNFKLMSSFNQLLIPADPSNTSDIAFTLGGLYRYSSRISVRAALDIFATSANFKAGQNLSQKVVTFGPSVLYYF